MARARRKAKEELGELSRLLLELRERSGLLQNQVRQQLDVSQRTVSRWESDAATPDVATARKLAQLYKAATPDERRRLIELVTTLEPARMDSRLIMQRGKNLHFQDRVREIERSCALVRAYQPGMILGQLQTPAYARAVFTAPRPSRPALADSPDALTVSRAGRYRQLTEDTRRRWVLIQTEGALNWAIGSGEDMAAQMDQIAQASSLPHVRVGIIPSRTPSQVFAPHGFHIYDSRAVSIGTRTATALTNDRHDLDDYEYLFGQLEQLAVYGDEARAILARTAKRYKGSTS